MIKEKNITEQFTTKELINVIKKIRVRAIFRQLDVYRYQDLKIEKYTETEQKIENLILGCIMHNERISIIIFEFLHDGHHFNKPENECIYQSITHLYAYEMDFTKNNLVEELKRKDELELVGGELYIEQLITNTLNEANLRNLPNLFLSYTIIDAKHLVFNDEN
jgi:hypothetical protein